MHLINIPIFIDTDCLTDGLTVLGLAMFFLFDTSIISCRNCYPFNFNVDRYNNTYIHYYFLNCLISFNQFVLLIGNSAFSACSKLTLLVLNNGLTIIGQNMFCFPTSPTYDSSLTKITILHRDIYWHSSICIQHSSYLCLLDRRYYPSTYRHIYSLPLMLRSLHHHLQSSTITLLDQLTL
jgi:hypothetical protein